MKISVENVKPYDKGSLRGFFDLAMDGLMTIRGCSVFSKGDAYWIAMPSKQYQGNDGATKYQPIVDMDPKRLASLRDLIIDDIRAELGCPKDAQAPLPIPPAASRTGRDGDAGQKVGTYAKKGAWAATAKPKATDNGWACGDVPNDRLNDVTFSSRELDMLVPIGTEPNDEF